MQRCGALETTQSSYSIASARILRDRATATYERWNISHGTERCWPVRPYTRYCCRCGAVALGACVIEKHFTLRRAEGGPDAAFSLEPSEFAALVRDCKTAWDALGEVREGYQSAAEPNLVFRRSLYAVCDIAPGAELTTANVRSIRPGHGLAPKYLPDILGRRACCAIARGTPLSWDLVE